MGKPNPRIFATSWARDEAPLRAIRQAVFVVEQAIAEADEFDALDPECFHFLAVSEKRDAVGTVRLEPIGKISRLAVIGSQRGLGIGKGLLKAAVEKALETQPKTIWLHAQTHATEFYERQGFFTVGESFDEVGIEHIRMCLTRKSA